MYLFQNLLGERESNLLIYNLDGSVKLSIFIFFSKTKLKKLSQYPEPPPPDVINDKFAEEMRNAQIRRMRERQEQVLQKRK